MKTAKKTLVLLLLVSAVAGARRRDPLTDAESDQLREVAQQPITTLLSGPAAGALGAALLAQAAGFERVLTLDGGGTSTDVAVIDAGQPHVTTEGRVGPFPVKVPMIDIATVGAGLGLGILMSISRSKRLMQS